jgi:hypothetical protein
LPCNILKIYIPRNNILNKHGESQNHRKWLQMRTMRARMGS